MEAHILRIIDALAACDTYRVAFRLDIDLGLVDPWQLNDGDEVVALLKNVDGRLTSHASRAAAEPITQLPTF